MKRPAKVHLSYFHEIIRDRFTLCGMRVRNGSGDCLHATTGIKCQATCKRCIKARGKSERKGA